MSTIVTNSMIFHNEGSYDVKRLNKEEFCEIVKKAHRENKLKSYIGYPDTVYFLQKNTGVNLKITTRKLFLKDGDKIAVIKKRYVERKDFAKPRGNDTDYEYFSIHFRNRQKHEDSSNRQPEFRKHETNGGRA